MDIQRCHTPRIVALLLLLGVHACEEPGERDPLAIEGTGTIVGSTFLDLTRSQGREAGDRDLPGAPVAIVMEGTRDTFTVVVTNLIGELRVTDVPPGSYRASIDPALLGDSLEITETRPPVIGVRANAESTILIGASFMVRSIPELRDEREGIRRYVNGVALNRLGQLPGSALHIWDGSQALRTLDHPGFAVRPGDDVRVLGRTRRTNGQMTLSFSSGTNLTADMEQVPPPEPNSLTTLEARTARNGSLDAALARVDHAEVLEVSTAFGRTLARVSDGSGVLEVDFPAGLPGDGQIQAVVPGMVLRFTGLLVPKGDGTWQLFPRSGADLLVRQEAPDSRDLGSS